MILESAQLLCTALRLNGATHLAKYKKTHENHPSNVWARQTRSNYMWLYYHLEALCTEYTFRYGKIHATAALLHDLKQGASFIPDGPLTTFANCAARSDMGLDKKWMTDPIIAYRYYLIYRWLADKKQPKWTSRHRPSFVDALNEFSKTLTRIGL
jgi:hypothetical protein